MEGRDQLEGVPREPGKDRTQSRGALSAGLARVQEAARRGRRTRFTALLHHFATRMISCWGASGRGMRGPWRRSCGSG